MSSKQTNENKDVIKKCKYNKFNPISGMIYVVVVVGLCLLCWIKNTIEITKKLYIATFGRLVIRIRDIFNDNGNTANSIKEKAVAKRKTTITFLRKSFNYVLPAIALVLVLRLVSDYNSTKYAIEVSSGENILGYVLDEQTYVNAEKLLKDQLVIVNNDDISTPAPKFKVVKVNPEEIMNDKELLDKLTSSIDNIVPAEGLFVEDVFVGAVEDIGTVKDVLDKRIEKYKKIDGVVDANFVNNIKVETGLYLSEHIVNIEEIDCVINEDTNKEDAKTDDAKDKKTKVRSVGNVDTLGHIEEYSRVAAKLSSDIEIENNIQMQNLSQDTTKVLEVLEEPFAVEYTIKEIKKQKIKFRTVKKENKDITVGNKIVEQKGENGILEVVSEMKMIDGKKVEGKVLKKQILKQPVDEEVVIGTAAEKYIWPLVGGYVSSGFGYRWGAMHNALDIAMQGGAYGKPIIASKSGTVIFSGYDGTYGNIVRISHDGDEESWYAHNSSNLVNVGDKVSQGEVIAKVGRTGSATGPHVHFEIRKNGNAKDPYSLLTK